ncbi:putative prefoldin subunit [Fasciolopsis buskii]|uniref:Putative prefoldin subunit n=1 Tax=Fasciolopsis buskii TaxID=27845 RepID=A0A8E0VI24_9TREM|nr:putative prefoldin subunit [Fasciolopsis buski]
MTSKVDPDVKKQAIEAHRQQTITANQQIALLNVQLDGLNVKHRRSELIEQELKTLPEDVVTYKATGRMFIKRNIPAILEGLLQERASIIENIDLLKNNREGVSKSLAESKEALRELLNAKQNS